MKKCYLWEGTKDNFLDMRYAELVFLVPGRRELVVDGGLRVPEGVDLLLPSGGLMSTPSMLTWCW